MDLFVDMERLQTGDENVRIRAVVKVHVVTVSKIMWGNDSSEIIFVYFFKNDVMLIMYNYC